MSHRVLDKIGSHPVMLGRLAPPPVEVSDADLRWQDAAQREARKRRREHVFPARVPDGLVPPGTVLVCASCRAASPFLLSCLHTFRTT